MRASNSHLSEWKLLLSPCLRILENSQLDYHFPGYSKIKDYESNDPPPLSEGSLNGLLLWVLCQMARTPDLTTKLRCYSNVHRWLGTTSNWGLVIVLPDKQLYQHCLATWLFCLWCNRPNQAEAALLLRFLYHTQLDKYPVVPLWMSDWLITEAATYATHNTRGEHPCPQQDLNPWSQQLSSCTAML
jgi:hypothetical protein